jgi:hypothetical protein
VAENQINTFSNLGFSLVKLTDDEIAPIKLEVKKIENSFEGATKHNQRLAGNIKKEFLLSESKEHISKLLLPLVAAYNSYNGNWVTKTVASTGKFHPVKKIALENVWVNFQKKYEFNPPHSHDGLLSFVIWIKIPFLMEEELKNSPGAESNTNIPGCFNFHYTDILGDLMHCPIYADKKMENHLLMFPAKLNHSVSPFYTSDEYRISVAGNFVVDIQDPDKSEQ